MTTSAADDIAGDGADLNGLAAARDRLIAEQRYQLLAEHAAELDVAGSAYADRFERIRTVEADVRGFISSRDEIVADGETKGYDHGARRAALSEGGLSWLYRIPQRFGNACAWLSLRGWEHEGGAIGADLGLQRALTAHTTGSILLEGDAPWDVTTATVLVRGHRDAATARVTTTIERLTVACEGAVGAYSAGTGTLHGTDAAGQHREVELRIEYLLAERNRRFAQGFHVRHGLFPEPIASSWSIFIAGQRTRDAHLPADVPLIANATSGRFGVVGNEALSTRCAIGCGAFVGEQTADGSASLLAGVRLGVDVGFGMRTLVGLHGEIERSSTATAANTTSRVIELSGGVHF